jgi:homoserine kinase type II
MNTSDGIDTELTVFVVQHVHVLDDESEEVKMIGVYSSRQKADEAVARLKSQPGFCHTPQGFAVSKYVIDRDHWPEGYVTAYLE